MQFNSEFKYTMHFKIKDIAIRVDEIDMDLYRTKQFAMKTLRRRRFGKDALLAYSLGKFNIVQDSILVALE